MQSIPLCDGKVIHTTFVCFLFFNLKYISER